MKQRVFLLPNFRPTLLSILLSLGLLLTFSTLHSEDKSRPLLDFLQWRELGPGNFSGRIVDVEALESDFRHVVVASASGGVWKSTNAGTTWSSIFDNYGTSSIGDIAIFQKNPDILWVGTGEANNRNSVAWGDGIYKSMDGGKTFRNMGLHDSYQIARIVLHPDDEETIYAAVIGNLWGHGGERGVFKSTDGGESWTRLTGGLPDDGKTGATDLVMDPKDPETLFVAFYERLRRPYRFDSGGPAGGIFKTTDGGKSWKKLTRGLPAGETGRIGLDIYRSNPQILVAIVEHGFQPAPDDPAYADMSQLGTGIYRSEDGGESWNYLNRYNNRPFYYSQIRIDPNNDQNVYVLTTTIQISGDGGKTFQPGGESFEGGLDYHALWFDPADSSRYYLGKDKGLTLTQDGGRTFQLFDNLPVAQFYAIGVDMRDPYYVYGGTQDNGTWGGPSFSRDVRGILNDRWWKLHWGDGMFVQIDPHDWRNVYTEAENGSFRRYDALTREVEHSHPSPINILNFKDFSPPEEAESGRLPEQFRFNWRSPLILSQHNSQTLYLGGNYLFKSVDGGRHWRIISPDLSKNEPEKVDRESGGLTRDVTGAEEYGTITALSESPLIPDLIWAGTDDGNLQLSQNGGVNWTNVRSNLSGVPPEIWISSLEASHFAECRAYVTLDGHRSSRFDTWLFRTDDCGRTWLDLAADLPSEMPLYVIREDLKNENLLFVGSETGVFVSLNRGDSWHRLDRNLPTVAVYDLIIHPRDADLIAGTHGRGIWILDDISPLQQLSGELLDTPAHVFTARPLTLWNDDSRGGVRGQAYFAGENPAFIPHQENYVRGTLESGGLIHYYLKEELANPVRIEIFDSQGGSVRTLYGSEKAGIQRLLWDLRRYPLPEQLESFKNRLSKLIERISAFSVLQDHDRVWVNEQLRLLQAATRVEIANRIREAVRDRFSNLAFLRRAWGEPLKGNLVEPGAYRIVVTVGQKRFGAPLVVRNDPQQ